jgi:transposase
MALGKKPGDQQEMWIATQDIPKSPGHPFYKRLNRMLAEADFDGKVEYWCEPYYAKVGRPSIPPGVYFRMLFVGYFEGIDSQRGIAWRCSDSLSLKEFLGYGVTDSTPDHSSLTVIRKRLPLEIHHQVFLLVLEIAKKKKLLKGKTVAVDSTTLEANAAMKSIVLKKTGEDWKEYLKRLAKEEGIEDPSDEDLRRFDKKRKCKKVSNKDWESKTDPDSRITRMKDGRTHLAYKAEHTVDLETDLVLSAEVHRADREDPDTLVQAIVGAQMNLMSSGSEAVIRDAAADKGYHSAENLEILDRHSVRTYIPEKKLRGRRKWKDKQAEQQQAYYTNRGRMKGNRGKALQRKRSELTERSFAHVYETGGARRTWLRGVEDINKRYLIQVTARNLGLVVRQAIGVGTPRSLQKEGIGPFRSVSALRFVIHSLTRKWVPGFPLAFRFGKVFASRTRFEISAIAG